MHTAHHRRRHLLMLLLGWPLLSVLANSGRISRWLDFGATTLQIAGAMAMWAVLGMAMSAALWLPWRRWMARSPLTTGRLLVLVALCLVAGVGFEAIQAWLDWPIPVGEPPKGRAPRSAWSRAFVPGVALFSWFAVQHLLETLERLGAERERALQAESLATEARLAMLRNELNPHFLFNAMNSIIGVIEEDPPKAQRMVRQLSGLLRHTLGGPTTSTLQAEVEVAQKYLAIEQVRFEERLRVEVDVPAALATYPVPPMLLQPLVENAIKHGMGVVPLTVRIDAQTHQGGLRVRVVHPGRLGPLGRGVGLRNLRDRLALVDGDASFELSDGDGQVVAAITLPGPRP
jgi:two-component system, LytTR family, sensor kinase